MSEQLWKIIRVDNYDRENQAQYCVAEKIPYKKLAEIMLESLQKNPERSDSDWYTIVEQEKELWLGMAEFADLTCDICGADCYPDIPPVCIDFRVKGNL